jgi:hypothetical protein
MAAPLSKLNSNIGQTENAYNLRYPLDVGSSNKKHYVQFQIFESSTNKDESATSSVDTTNIDKAINNANPKDKNDNILSSATATSVGLTGNANPFGNGRITIATRSTENPVGSIALYIPDEVVQQQSAQYGEVSLIQAASVLTGGVIGAAASYVDIKQQQGQGVGMILNYIGYTFNPQEQLMFEGIEFRTFNMSFTFTPANSKESLIIRDIIQTFRQHAAPRISTFLRGFFYTPPSQFYVQYYLAGTENNFINKFKRSVLQSVAVNYAPNGNGWSAHSDGAPVQTTLTLEFKELEMVDKLDIRDRGY